MLQLLFEDDDLVKDFIFMGLSFWIVEIAIFLPAPRSLNIQIYMGGCLFDGMYNIGYAIASD